MSLLLLHTPSTPLRLGCAVTRSSLRGLHMPALTLTTPLGAEAGVGARTSPPVPLPSTSTSTSTSTTFSTATPARTRTSARARVGAPLGLYGLHTGGGRAFPCPVRMHGLHTSALRAAPSPAAPPSPPSTALNPNIRAGESAPIVGAALRGAEGAHYNDRMPDAAAPLSDMAQGGWTMMNPIYTEADLDKVKVVGREPVTISDKAAHGVVKLLRRCFDLCTGYVAKDIPPEVLQQKPLPIAELRAKGQLLSDKDWLLRIILLESIAGVPGMVGGTLRHLRSLRLLRRDGGWIHTLLEEAENERMHLLTFLAVSQPTYLTRGLVMIAQAGFYCAFFGTYMIAPKTAHRFVGALEEEAVRTYTHCIADVQAGLVPEWDNKPAPQIAIDYWRMDEDASLLDVIKAVRADEATHRFVNHSLANLDQEHDFNPFALAEASPELRGTKPGFTRDESAEFARMAQAKMLPKQAAAHEAEPKAEDKPGANSDK